MLRLGRIVGGGQIRRPVGDHFGEERGAQDGVWGLQDMRSGAGPRVVDRLRNQPCLHRVAFDVPHGGQQMGLIEGDASKAALPEVPAPALPEVHPPRVAPVSLPQAPRQALRGPRDEDQVDMVRHEAVRPTLEPKPFALGFELMEIGPVISLSEEDGLATVAALGDMVRQAWDRHACKSGHLGSWAKSYV